MSGPRRTEPRRTEPPGREVLATVPATTWRDGLDEPDELHGLDGADRTGAPLLFPARAGVHLGTDQGGKPVSLPAPGPAGTRVAVLGESLFCRLVALRLLAVGVQVTADTRLPAEWRRVRQAAGGRLSFTRDPATWPALPPAPPAVGAGPQALVSDQHRPPPASAAAGPWRTVLHVTRGTPRRAGFWDAPDALLALGPTYAAAVALLLGREAGRRTARLASGEVILFRADGAEVLRPDIAPAETALLTPGQTRARISSRQDPPARPT
ncbi:hypothetical protein ACTWP5_00850 [Streptomyces sp. 4N509B]|uniref:hypothetical protein n=1 Tax=Streptomyces sp. 4N509B TaxID=3457413 RepID=UPI003FD43EED